MPDAERSRSASPHHVVRTVDELAEASGVGQSTVSHRLKILAEVRFVLVERQGTSSFYRINENCVSCFPTAADVVMGKPVPDLPACT
ncbi:ArsR/SmtB family transcription factor [Streptosporangium sp. NPDC001559]|uniref:ArsR/SmtB family transcription factor n=1 Tax=Streptosporangium sp. NPDC001559 TaxID=3366187 RepID=UPI0036EAC577